MNKPHGRDEIVLSGPPQNAAALLPIDATDRLVAVTLQLPGGPSLYHARVKPFGAGNSEVRLHLPRETPPGTYSGEVTVAGERRRISVKVEPIANVRIDPDHSEVTAAAGARANFTVDVVNRGNVPIEIPGIARFDLTDARGQNGALGRALRATLAPDERRVDRFFEELRAAHGGEARVTVTHGSGLLPPAEARSVTCALDVPGDAQPGTYSGSWGLANTSHRILIEVASATLRKPRTPA